MTSQQMHTEGAFPGHRQRYSLWQMNAAASLRKTHAIQLSFKKDGLVAEIYAITQLGFKTKIPDSCSCRGKVAFLACTSGIFQKRRWLGGRKQAIAQFDSKNDIADGCY